MTPIAAVTAVPTETPVPAKAPTPARGPAADFGAVLGAKTTASPSLDAPRAAASETTGEAFEAAMLVPFVAAMLPPEDSEIWGGTGGAMWRGLFADALATDLARAGGVGIAEIVDRTLAGHARPLTPSIEGTKA